MAEPQMMQFYVASGRAWETGPGIGVFHHSRAGLWLYTLAEAVPATRDAPCHRAVATMEAVMRGWSLSLSSGLREGLVRVHREQQANNEDSGEEVGVGVSCALLRGSQVFLAQAGPSLAYIWSHGGLTTLTPAQTQPLGLPGYSGAVDLHQHRIAAGDVLLLASSLLLHLTPLAGIEALLASSLDEAARGLYRLARQEDTFSALLLRPAYWE